MTDTQLIQSLSRGLRRVLRGQQQLATLRRAIEVLHETEQLILEFDPSTPPELIDYLTVIAARAGVRAAQGAAFGLLVGLLLKRPGIGATVGALAGAGLGVAEGIERVKRGWRVRAGWDEVGEPWAVVEQFLLEGT